MYRINLHYALLIALSIVSISNAAACNIANPPSVVIGNNAALCFKVDFSTNSSTSSTWYLFRVKIDQFSSLKLTNLAQSLNSTLANATVTVYFQNQETGTSFILLDTGLNIQRSIISLVINTVGGSYDSIVGDNFCDSSCGNCYNGQCYDTITTGGPDLRVYISWGGSDAKNNQYLSQSSRLSRFNLYSISSLYSSVKNVYFS